MYRLAEYTYFYISKNITSYNFLLVFKIVKSFQFILKKEEFCMVGGCMVLKTDT